MANVNTANKQLNDLLISKDFNVNLLDASGKPAQTPEDADIFSFDFVTPNTHDYGTVVILITDDHEMEVYCADNVGKAMEGEDKQIWFDFLAQIKNLARRNLMSFGIRNLNHLKYSMQGQSAIKEGLFESWKGNKTTSYNDKPNAVRLMIKHNRSIAEGDVRFRHIDSLFLETSDGERFKLPFNRLSGGKAMCEHVRNGGKPYDARGNHISQLVDNVNVLSRFKKTKKSKALDEASQPLSEMVNTYYESARKTLKSLSTKRGYRDYFENWDPSEIKEEELVVEDAKHYLTMIAENAMALQLNPFIEGLVNRDDEMKEIAIFESYMNVLSEGVWALPDTKEKQSKLIELLNNEFPVGPDATNASGELYDVLGDDELFDRLKDLAKTNPDGDARYVILARMDEMIGYPGIEEVLQQVDAAAPQETPIQQSQQEEPAPEEQAPIPPEQGAEEEPEIPSVSESEECVCEEGDDDCDCHEKKKLGESKMTNLNEDYGINLADILKQAGLAVQSNPSPDYEDGMAKYSGEECSEEIGSGEANPGVAPEQVIDETGEEEEGAELGINRIKELSGMPMDECDMEEGAVGSTIGGALGTAAGAKLGSMAADALGAGTLGKMAGGVAGAALGGWGGSKLGDKVGDMLDPDEPEEQDQDESLNEVEVTEGSEFNLSRLKQLSGFLIK